MKRLALMTLTGLLVACADQSAIKRTHYESYEQQIGFTQVVQHGDRLYVSGVTAPGPDMQKAVKVVYGSIQKILKKHGASLGDVVKENVYTTDMAALKSQIDIRKQFYPEGIYPAATWVEVTGLFMPEFILEVEVEVIVNDKN